MSDATMHPETTVKAVMRRGERHYLVECLGISLVTQGVTLGETVENCVRL